MHLPPGIQLCDLDLARVSFCPSPRFCQHKQILQLLLTCYSNLKHPSSLENVTIVAKRQYTGKIGTYHCHVEEVNPL